jgi:dihydroflavonol-4-reductase
VEDPQTQLVDPAVKGTTNVLESCDKTGSIQRVVFTSSMAAISDETRTDVVFSERDWNEKSSLTRNPYYYSKMLAERAAWQFMEENPRFDLVAINPSVVIGSSLCPSLNTSNRIIRDLMAGQYPAIMNLSWVFVDVRDVAKAHALAMTRQEASGRYLCANSTLSMRKIVQLLKRNGYSDFAFPRIELTSKLADAFVRAASYTYPRGTGSYLRTHIGKAMRFDNQKIQGELGIEFIPVEQSVLDTVEDLLRWGHLKQR